MGGRVSLWRHRSIAYHQLQGRLHPPRGRLLRSLSINVGNGEPDVRPREGGPLHVGGKCGLALPPSALQLGDRSAWTP